MTSSSSGHHSSLYEPLVQDDDHEQQQQMDLVSSPSEETVSENDELSSQLPQNCEGATIDVVSPATLPGGFSFWACVGDSGPLFLVTVPVGGVRKGERIPYVLRTDSTSSPSIDFPVGTWRDGMCDCFRYGCFHPSILNALFCPASEYTMWFKFCILLQFTGCKLQYHIIYQPLSTFFSNTSALFRRHPFALFACTILKLKF